MKIYLTQLRQNGSQIRSLKKVLLMLLLVGADCVLLALTQRLYQQATKLNTL